MEENEAVRINKYLAISGVCSRREADRYIEEQRVYIDGVAAQSGTKVMPGQTVTVDGRSISPEIHKRVYALYKPAGYISSLSDEQGEGIKNFVPSELRLFPVGRLDKDSEGLMLLTNDGELMNAILKASGGHEKEYLVTVNQFINSYFIKNMEKGVPITNGATGEKIMTAPCRVIQTDRKEFRIILIQGLNRQIRRMCGFFSFNVLNLKRVRILNIELGSMKPGEYREITGEELQELKRMIGE